MSESFIDGVMEDYLPPRVTKEIRRLEAKVAELEEYANHKGHCDIVFLNMIDLKCTCGFDDV